MDLHQHELATLAGIRPGSLRDVEQARNTNPPIGLLIRCAVVLGCPIEELIEESWWKRIRKEMDDEAEQRRKR
jgi:transcriptional regulator with XRE-family HTH domain